jgi:hypothetical protein
VNNLNKIPALLFSVLLLVIGGNIENYNPFDQSEPALNKGSSKGSAFSGGKLSFELPFHQSERVNTRTKDLPVSMFKKRPTIICLQTIPPVITEFCSCQQLAFYSVSVYLNLTRRDIIFPFHYFL